MYFKNTNNIPPGGRFEYEGPNHEYVSGRSFAAIEPLVRRILNIHGITKSPEEAVADYMCPRMEGASWFCTGMPTGMPTTPTVRPKEAMANSEKFCSKTPVTHDVISARLAICMNCPKHKRDWCPTCTGHIDRIRQLIPGRPKLAEDKATGVCMCTKAYEAAISSVEYAKEEPVWEGAPETCWRHHDV